MRGRIACAFRRGIPDLAGEHAISRRVVCVEGSLADAERALGEWIVRHFATSSCCAADAKHWFRMVLHCGTRLSTNSAHNAPGARKLEEKVSARLRAVRCALQPW